MAIIAEDHDVAFIEEQRHVNARLRDRDDVMAMPGLEAARLTKFAPFKAKFLQHPKVLRHQRQLVILLFFLKNEPAKNFFK